MLRLIAVVALLAADGGAASVAPRTVRVENLGAAPVTLLLQLRDGRYAWGPYELGPHELIRVEYCPCADLTLELRTPQRTKPLKYPLRDQTALLLSEDRWSEGEPLVRRDEGEVHCAPSQACGGPAFKIAK